MLMPPCCADMMSQAHAFQHCQYIHQELRMVVWDTTESMALQLSLAWTDRLVEAHILCQACRRLALEQNRSALTFSSSMMSARPAFLM